MRPRPTSIDSDTLSIHSLHSTASTNTLASSIVSNSSAVSFASGISGGSSCGGSSLSSVPGSNSLTADRRRAARERLSSALAATKPWRGQGAGVGTIGAFGGGLGSPGRESPGRESPGLRAAPSLDLEGGGGGGGGGGKSDALDSGSTARSRQDSGKSLDEMGSEIPVAEGGEDEEMVKMRTSQMGRLNLITAASGWDIKLRELVMREAKEGDLLSPSTPTSPSTTSQSSTSPTSANQNPTSAAAALHARRLSSRRSTPLLSIPSQHTTLSLNARSSILLSPQPLDLPTPSYFDPAAAAHHNRPRSQTLYRRASQFNTIVRGYDERLREIVMEAAKPALEDGVRARTLGMRRSGLWTRRGTPFTSTSTSDNNFDLSDVQRARDWVQTQSFTHDSASDSDSDSDASSSASTSSSSDSEDDNDPPTARTPRRQSIPHLLPTTDTTRPTLVVKDEPAPSLSSHSELSRNPSGKSNHRIRRVSAVQVVVPPNLKGGVDVSGKEVAGGGVKSAKGKSGTKKTSGEREKAVGKGDATDATSSRTVPILKQPAPRRTPATATTPGTKKILKPSDSKPTKSSTTPSSPPITTPTSSPTPPEPDSTPTLNPKSPDKDKPPPSSSSSSRPSSSPVKKSLKKSTPTTSPTFSPKSPKSPASPPHKSTRTPKTIRTKPTSSSSASTSTPANPKSRNVRFEDHRSSPPGSPPGVKNAKASGAGVVEHAKRVSDVSDGGGKDSAVEC